MKACRKLAATDSGLRVFHSLIAEGKNDCLYVAVLANGTRSLAWCPLVVLPTGAMSPLGALMSTRSFMIRYIIVTLLAFLRA